MDIRSTFLNRSSGDKDREGRRRRLTGPTRWLTWAKLVGEGDRQIRSLGAEPTLRSDGEAARPQTHRCHAAEKNL